MSRSELEALGFVYWEDFFNRRMGNHWGISPKPEMMRDFHVIRLEKMDYVTKEKTPVEVLFDSAYVEAWIKYHGLSFMFSFGKVDFSAFEEENKIEVSLKNPRHSLYIKFKEFTQCPQQ